MRTFLSINLTPAIHGQIQDLQESLRAYTRDIRWTRPENCHLTLKFLGEFPEEHLPKLGEILDPVAAQFSPFSIKLGSLGTFPPKGPISILWLGVSEGDALVKSLEMEIQQALTQAGISFDKKKSFLPHLTIGRAKKEKRVYLNLKKNPPRFAMDPLLVDAFYTMQSE
ncbi:RNA 2',3'-cyclic phosphodiesterase, partial [bacterium]|nr:RNA 2',3'-cyclic phosphodiesterase [bacterium]